MQFRGREMAYKEQGLEKFKGIIAQVIELGGIVESPVKLMGNRVITILSPDKKLISKLKLEEESKKSETETKNEEEEANI